MTSFTAKDGDGTNIEIAAHLDTGNGIYFPTSMIPALPMVSQFVDSLGTGLGTININGDYSGGATDFWIEPPAGEIWHIARLIATIQDTGTLRAEFYGAASALTNGIKIIHEVNSSESDLTSQLPITNIGEFASYSFDANEISTGAGDNFIIFRWTFARSGTVLELDGDNNDKLIVRVNDDHTDLVGHRFMVQGHKLVGS